MERGETTQGEMCPMAHGWALESPDQLCLTSVYGVSLTLSGNTGWDLASVILLYVKVW